MEGGKEEGVCDVCSHTGACVEKDHTCDLMLCGCHVEILNNFWTGALHFHSVLGLTNYVVNPERERKMEVGRGREKDRGRERKESTF